MKAIKEYSILAFWVMMFFALLIVGVASYLFGLKANAAVVPDPVIVYVAATEQDMEGTLPWIKMPQIPEAMLPEHWKSAGKHSVQNEIFRLEALLYYNAPGDWIMDTHKGVFFQMTTEDRAKIQARIDIFQVILDKYAP